MTAAARISDGIRIAIGLAIMVPLLIVAALCLTKLYVTAEPMIAASWAHYQDVHQVHVDPVKQKAYRDKYFKMECGDYFAQSWIIRKTSMRAQAWCEMPEYKDRL